MGEAPVEDQERRKLVEEAEESPLWDDEGFERSWGVHLEDPGRKKPVEEVESRPFRDKSEWEPSESHQWEPNHMATPVDSGIHSHQYRSLRHFRTLYHEFSSVQLHRSTIQKRGRSRQGR